MWLLDNLIKSLWYRLLWDTTCSLPWALIVNSSPSPRTQKISYICWSLSDPHFHASGNIFCKGLRQVLQLTLPAMWMQDASVDFSKAHSTKKAPKLGQTLKWWISNSRIIFSTPRQPFKELIMKVIADQYSVWNPCHCNCYRCG